MTVNGCWKLQPASIACEQRELGNAAVRRQACERPVPPGRRAPHRSMPKHNALVGRTNRVFLSMCRGPAAPSLAPQLCLAAWAASFKMVRAQQDAVVTTYQEIMSTASEDEHLNESETAWRNVTIAIVPVLLLGSLLTCLLGELVSRGGFCDSCGNRGNQKLWLPQLYESHLRQHGVQVPTTECQPIISDPEAAPAGRRVAVSSSEQVNLPQPTTNPVPTSLHRVYT